MSKLRDSRAGFDNPVDGLPLFDAAEAKIFVEEVQTEIQDNSELVDQILKSFYFDVPIELTTSYTNTLLKEIESPVKFLGIVVDSSGNTGFAIEIDHDYEREFHSSYTRNWHLKGKEGVRDTYTYYKRQSGKKQYTLFSTWWRGENQTHIAAYNGKVKKRNSKKANILTREGLLPLVNEMVELANKKGLL